MIRALLARWKQGYQTKAFPKKKPLMPERFQGCPTLKKKYCDSNCRICLDVCPTEAISKRGKTISLDLGKCLFCGKCETACPQGIIHFSKDYAMATSKRKELVMDKETLRLANAMDQKIKRIFGRSLRLRVVSAGGCNACEADVNVLTTIGFDLGKFGIQYVAGPRHADGLLITGPVTQNMVGALKKTYEAIAQPKVVIAVGTCAISGGIYAGHSETCDGVDKIFPVDLYIPGCPPNPYTILDGFLRLIDRIPQK